MKYPYKIQFLFNKQPKDDVDIITETKSPIAEKRAPSGNKTSVLLHKLRFIIIHGFQPIYEIEYQENKWVQLEDTTSKYIEELYQRGFTRITIRQDKQLNGIIPEPAISIISISTKNESILEKDKVFSIRRKKLSPFKNNNNNEKWSLSFDLVLLKEDQTIVKPLSYTEPPFLF